MKPATSSDSASGKSKGTLLLSTSTQALYITKRNILNSITLEQRQAQASRYKLQPKTLTAMGKHTEANI